MEKPLYKKPTLPQIYDFIKSVEQLFPVPLSEKVDLETYAQKLWSKATLCGIIRDGKILSLTAGYTQELLTDMAYISLVATLPEAQGMGLATKTVKEFVAICKKMKLSGVHLYTTHSNTGARRLYEEMGFRPWRMETEQRPKDLHMILYLNKEEIE